MSRTSAACGLKSGSKPIWRIRASRVQRTNTISGIATSIVCPSLSLLRSWLVLDDLPTACAVGFILTPLRGLRRRFNGLTESGVATSIGCSSLSLFRSWLGLDDSTHGLRRGLYSDAASRLAPRVQPINRIWYFDLN